jgi:hypothetical protein
MPKLLKQLGFERKFPPVFDYYAALYSAYRKYYVVFINRQYKWSCIRFKNLLTATMLFKELESMCLRGRFLSKYDALKVCPYWVIPRRQFDKKFWKMVKESKDSLLSFGAIEELMGAASLDEFLEDK